MALVAAVLLNALSRAKGRLGTALPADARRELSIWMGDHVLETLANVPAVDTVLLVAGDPDAAQVGIRRGVQAVVEPRPGIGVALAAVEAAVPADAALLVLAGDLPLVAPDDVTAVVSAAGPRPAVVVAPTADGGTAALLRAPATVIPTAYGPGSAAAHLLLGRTTSAATARVDRPGLSLDVDTPGQLRTAALVCGALTRWSGAVGR